MSIVTITIIIIIVDILRVRQEGLLHDHLIACGQSGV